MSKIGKFIIPSSNLHKIHDLKALFANANLEILRSSQSFQEDAVIFVAKSDLFEEVDPNAPIPEYSLCFSKDRSGIKIVGVSKSGLFIS